MDATLTALGISFFSLLVAGLSLGWNIYRDVVLKPRLRVRFQVSTLVHPAMESRTYLDVSATNHGPGRVTCNMIHVKTASLWRTLTRRIKHGVIVGDWTNPMSAKLPKVLEVGDRATFLIPYDKDCFLSGETTHIGVLDSFGRTHWAGRRNVEEARAVYQKDFGQRKRNDRRVV